MSGPLSVLDLESSASARQGEASGDLTPTTPGRLSGRAPLSATSGAGLILESGLLPALYARARRGSCRRVEVDLAADGSAQLVISGVSLTPDTLERLAAGMDDEAAAGAPWERVLSGAPGVELDLFGARGPGGQQTQWHLSIVKGVWMGRLARVLHPEPSPGSGDQGVLRLRLRASPDDGDGDLPIHAERELLVEQLADLAMIAPGVETVVTAPSEGLSRRTLLPRGPGQRLAQRTEGRLTLLESPLEIEARWQGLRARIAVQWCVDGPTQLWGFEDGRRCGARDAAIGVLLSTLRAGLALHGGGGLERVPLGRMMRGLTAIVALDRVRAPQRCEVVRGSLTASGVPTDRDLMNESVRELTPLLVAALAVNPGAGKLLRWVTEALPEPVAPGRELV